MIRQLVLSLFSMLLLGLTLGCSADTSWPTPLKAAPPVKHDWIAEMKSLARTHHMRYRIICLPMSDDPNRQFAAYLVQKPWEEDLNTQYWVSGAGPTQAEAAHDLITLFYERGFYPLKPPQQLQKIEQMHKTCPPEVRGDEFAQEKP